MADISNNKRKWQGQNKSKKAQHPKFDSKNRSRENSATRKSVSVNSRCKPRRYTVSIAVPGSIVQNAQSRELQIILVGQIARAAAIYLVDEVVVYDDKTTDHVDKWGKPFNPQDFVARILQYMETPQYLRKVLVPMHSDLRLVGLLHPLDSSHHLRSYEGCRFREGVVVEKTADGKQITDGSGSYVYTGARHEALIDVHLPPGMRVTVELDEDCRDPNSPRPHGKPVAASKPREELGLYWGFSTRIAESLTEVLSQCPFDVKYDLTIGTSERGTVSVDQSNFSLKPFKHALIVFGGVQGIESSIDNDESIQVSGSDAKTMFDYWVNTCTEQGSRTIRTEEAVLLSLARLQPALVNGGNLNKR